MNSKQRACSVRSRHLRSYLMAVLLVIPWIPACAGGVSDKRGDIPKNLLHVPKWAQDATWYQIFPERFRNGDPSNDPTVDDLVVSYPFERPREWQISRWTGDWYELQAWERAPGKKFYNIVHQRRYGGDLQGVLERLDYLKDLGVTALYFNPLFEAPSMHKYEASMYHHIDNNFGPDPAGDAAMWATERPEDPATWQWTSADKLFLTLIAEVHKRGMRVIIDGVFNHVGTQFWAFRDLRAKGAASPYRTWFTVTSWDDPATPADEFSYAGWAGLKDLPELREDENGLVAGPREHVHNVVKRWMDPNGDGDPSDGVDGWRLDVAERVAIPFWQEFRQWTRAINPDSYLTGEVWWEDWRNGKMFNAGPWLAGDVFDAVMNYRWADAACRFFKDRTKKISATDFDRSLRELLADYRPEVNYGLMNLYGSHDTDRLSSMIVNPDTDFDHQVSAADNSAYMVRKPTAEEVKRKKLMVLFQATFLGAPMVYYGDEAGMWGGDDPDCRKPMLWPEMDFDPEAAHPLGGNRPVDANAFSADMHAFYKEALTLRRNYSALRAGNLVTVITDDARDLYGFIRRLGEETILVILNNGPNEAPIRLRMTTLGTASRWSVIAGGGVPTIEGGNLVVTIPPVSGTVFRAER